MEKEQCAFINAVREVLGLAPLQGEKRVEEIVRFQPRTAWMPAKATPVRNSRDL